MFMLLWQQVRYSQQNQVENPDGEQITEHSKDTQHNQMETHEWQQWCFPGEPKGHVWLLKLMKQATY